MIRSHGPISIRGKRKDHPFQEAVTMVELMELVVVVLFWFLLFCVGVVFVVSWHLLQNPGWGDSIAGLPGRARFFGFGDRPHSSKLLIV